ncbi:MAG: TAT-variant-translocated molybdopterin oxidoreductase [Puniceicoccaceae bacterium]
MNQQSGPEYWKSLDEKVDSPEFKEWLHREFPEGASELNGVNRRNFLKVMAASLSLAGVGMAGCRQPRRHVLPYAKQPENVIQGVPNFFSSSMPMPWGNIPVIVESHQGRPTKVEGNPSFTRYRGATDAFTQASVLDLYDPDRLKRCQRGSNRMSRPEVLDFLKNKSDAIVAAGGKGVAILAEPSSSPARAQLVAELQAKAPELLWAEYEAVPTQGLEAASQRYLSKRMRAVHHLDRAKRVLSLDADFMGLEPDAIGLNRSYAKARKVRSAKEAAKMNRLYCVESNLTLTGAAADHRLRLSSSQIDVLTAQIASMLLEKAGLNEAARRLASISSSVREYQDWALACAEDLWQHKGEAVVMVGSHLSATSQLLSVLINEVLGAVDATVQYLDVTLPYESKGLRELTDALKAGSIKTLVLMGGNPVFDAPADLDFDLFAKTIDEVIRFAGYADETSAIASVQIAASHYLESWGDGRTYDGQYVPVQPLIEPLYETFSELEFLARLSGASTTDAFALVKQSASRQDSSLSKDTAFSAFLAEGILPDSGYEAATLDTSGVIDALTDEISAMAQLSKPSADALELRLVPSYHSYDGRFANNGWLMECPEPLTKLTWDNAILISPKFAKELEASTDLKIFATPSFLNKQGVLQRESAIFVKGKESAPMAKLVLGDVTLEAPVHVQPGLADYTVVLSKGFGRSVGRIATGTGFDAYPLTTLDHPNYRTGATLTLTGDTYQLANTQQHWAIEGRAIVRENTAADYIKDPEFVSKMGVESHSPKIYGAHDKQSPEWKAVNTPRGGGMYDPPDFTVKDRFHPTDPEAVWNPQQWGMTIDLNTCTGCNACVVACQSENNIPIVGKDQVLRGREMHWIRLDRYFSSYANDKTDIPDDVQVTFQGMACTHCELAPCETVCPVNATVHDEQGLNVMAYNRCVGTRYCANNCPYKVRRFNFFDWHKREIGKFYQGPLGPVDEPEVQNLGRNPDVTVRMRGVMEKCTYCVQRIEGAKIRQKSIARDSDNVKVPDGTIQTACQQVCPTQAIEFGDITDPESAVYQAKQSDLNYSVLGYLNIRPRTTYLAKLRNPNPEMPEKYRYASPFTRKEYKSKSHGGDSHAAHGAEVHEAHSGH